MKSHMWTVRFGWLALLSAFMSATSVSSRELLEDKELRGRVIKVDLRNKAFELDRGRDHKLKWIYWDHNTRFMFPDRMAKLRDLTTKIQVRVYYNDDASVSRHHKAIANKVVIHPFSDARMPLYNK